MPITSIKIKRGKDFDNLWTYSIKWRQEASKAGDPTTEPILEYLTLILVRSAEHDNSFYIKWQLDPTKQENIDLCFYDNKRLVRSWKIKKAYLVGYLQEYAYDPKNGTFIKETLTVSPLEIEMDGVTFKREENEES